MSTLPVHNHDIPIRASQYDWRKSNPVVPVPNMGYNVIRYPYPLASSLFQTSRRVPEMTTSIQGMGSIARFPMSAVQVPGGGENRGMVVVGGGGSSGSCDPVYPDQSSISQVLMDQSNKRSRP